MKLQRKTKGIFSVWGFGEGRVVEGAGQSRRVFLGLERRTFFAGAKQGVRFLLD